MVHKVTVNYKGASLTSVQYVLAAAVLHVDL